MMIRSVPRFRTTKIIAFGFLVAGCKDKPKPMVDVAPAAASSPPASPAEPVELAPLTTDTAPEAGVANNGNAKKTVHPPSGIGAVNEVRIKQCCAALRGQAKQLGTSPEATQLQTIAATCDVIATQVGSSAAGQAPELAPLRALLQNKALPAACSGL